jgi:hypothetical protein
MAPCLRSLFAMCWRENPGAYHTYIINKRGRALALGVDVVPLRANAADPCPDWRPSFELVRHGVGDPGLRGTALDNAAGHRDGLEQELRADFFGKPEVNGCRDRKLKLADVACESDDNRSNEQCLPI